MTALRRAAAVDAGACAAILNDWIDVTSWMPRVHAADDVLRHYREHVLPSRRVTVAEDAGVIGFLALDESEGFVTALYLDPNARGRGVGRMLLDEAKAARPAGLSLWTFVANGAARRFYAREGFAEARRTASDNEEGLPDILFEWRP